MIPSLDGVAFTPGQANAIGHTDTGSYDILWAFATRPQPILAFVVNRSTRIACSPRLCNSASVGQAMADRRANPSCLTNTDFTNEHLYAFGAAA